MARPLLPKAWLIQMGIAAGLGFAAVVLPVRLDPGYQPYAPDGFLPAVRTAVELMSPVTLLLLAVVGFGVAWFGRTPFWLIGLSTMGALPIWSFLDLLITQKGHNLLPIEWTIYFLLSLLGVIGAWFARSFRSLISDPPSAPTPPTA